MENFSPPMTPPDITAVAEGLTPDEARIVAWLEHEASEWRANGFMKEPFAFGLAARAIKRGEHRKHLEKPQ